MTKFDDTIKTLGEPNELIQMLFKQIEFVQIFALYAYL